MSDLNDCNTLISKNINSCLLRTERIGPLDGPTISVDELITIVENNLNQCAEYPLTINANACLDLEPGFCSSILQFVSGAWGIYRSPGITEITVGGLGSNFLTVADAFSLGPSGVTCRFVRITDNVTEPGLVLPTDTLIYIDPGVTWTVTGPLTMSGNFVLIGNNSQPSSTFSYGGFAGPCIQGTGSLFIENLHIVHLPQAAGGEILVSVSIPAVIKNVTVSLSNTVNGFVSDTAGPITQCTLDHVWLIGESVTCNLPINIQNAASNVRINMLQVSGTFLPNGNLTSTAPNIVWQGVRNDTSSSMIYRLSGEAIDFQDISNNCTVELSANTLFSQARINTARPVGNNTALSNIICENFNFQSSVSGLSVANLVTQTVVGNSILLDGINNFANFAITTVAALTITMSTGIGSQNSTFTNVSFPSDLIIVQPGLVANPGRILQLQNCRVAGNFDYNRNIAVISPGTKNLYLSQIEIGGNFRMGNSIAGNDTGSLFGANLVVNGDFTLLTNRQSASCEIDNFFVGGNTTLVTCGVLALNNGILQGDMTMTNPQLTNPKCSNIVLQGNLALGCTQGLFSNFACMGLIDAVTSASLTIGGVNAGITNDLTNFVTRRIVNANAALPPAAPPETRGGSITVSGSNNILTNFLMTGGSVSISGNSCVLGNWRILGTSIFAVDNANVPVDDVGAQTFTISGIACHLSNIHLGTEILDGNDPNFTDKGFGSNTNGNYSITFSGIGTIVDNFSLYPRRGQVGVDVKTGAPTSQTVTFGANGGMYSNMRFWFFPGSAAPLLSAHSFFTIDVTGTRHLFQNIFIGYGDESSVVVGATSLGTLNVTGANNSFRSTETFTLSAGAVTDAHFVGCKITATGSATVNNSATNIVTACRNFGALGGLIVAGANI